MAASITVYLENTPYRTAAHNGRHTVYFDEPIDAGGGDTAPDPTEMLLASLGSCSLITMLMYASRKGWKIRSARVELSEKAERTPEGWNTVIQRQIFLEGELDESQQERLLHISKRCPVAQMLTGSIAIETNLNIQDSSANATLPAL